MVAIGKGSTTDVLNPLLVFYAQNDGRLVDLNSLSFQIFDATTELKRVTPVQVYPATPGDKHVVNLVDERLGIGRYAPTWVAPAAASAVGRYFVRWFWKFTASEQERRARQVFEVLSGEPLGGPAYALVSDMRGECEDTKVPEHKLQAAILLASSMVENITVRFFEPRYALQRHDGNGSRALMLNDPVIAVESLSVDPRFNPLGYSTLDIADVRVYNRHVAQRLSNPDDRDNPKLEFIHGRDFFQNSDMDDGQYSRLFFNPRFFPTGVQNIIVPGVYGFTEWDGTPFGKTPEMVQYVTRLIAMRNLPTDDQCREQVRNGWRVIEERTRDQMIRYADPRKFGQWTGDADIDSVLSSLMRPVNLGSA